MLRLLCFKQKHGNCEMEGYLPNTMYTYVHIICTLDTDTMVYYKHEKRKEL